MIETIKNITNRSNENKSISVALYETRYVDIQDSGNLLGCVRERTLITGDCLKLMRKIEGIMHCYNVYTKQGGKYNLDTNQTLYVGNIFNSPDSMYYSVKVTEQEYQNLLQQKKLMKRNRVIAHTLSC